MKVSKAKTKVCPFMQYQESSLHELFNPTCICGDCMAWEYTNTHKHGGQKDPWDEGYDETQDEELPEDEKSGYCKRLTND